MCGKPLADENPYGCVLPRTRWWLHCVQMRIEVQLLEGVNGQDGEQRA